MTHWGILSTGHIAEAFARGVDELADHRIVAIGSRNQESADRFGETFDVAKRYASYDEVLSDAEVDAVYIGTPHPYHVAWCVKAAEAGKHILCEKPTGMSFAEVQQALDAAKQHDVFFMEAFMFRCNPQTEGIVKLIQQGAIGEVKLIRADFCINKSFDPTHRLFNKILGGGGILDLGCYPVCFSRHIAGAIQGKAFANPQHITAHGRLGPTDVDEWATATLHFTDGLEAQCHCGTQLTMSNDATIYGTEGHINIPTPWGATGHAGQSHITLHRPNKESQTIHFSAPHSHFAIEIEYATRYFKARQAPNMSWEDSLGNAETLDKWLAEVGVNY